MIQSSLRGALCAVLLASAPANAQRAVPTIVLDKGSKELTEPFTRVTGLVELRDGRLLVGDTQENEIWLVDFSRDVRAQAARSGAGPTEIRTGMLLTGAADTAVFFDMVQRRLLIFSPAGAPLETRLLGTGRADPLAVLSGMQPRFVDATGRIFGQSSGMKMPSMAKIEGGGNIGEMMPTFADTVTIERLDPKTGQTDTLARIRNVVASSVPKMEMTGAVMKFTMRGPDMRAIDAWAVLPDGRVAILRDGNYRVEFVTPRRPVTQGPPIAHPLIPLTAAEKKAAMDSIRTQMARITQQISGAAAGAAGPKMEFEVLEPPSWPATKAAYLGIIPSPDGRLWVQTPLPLTEKGSAYDVLDGGGALIARVRTVPGESIVGLGRGTAYTTRKDADDLVYLRRYALPPPIGPGR